MPSTASILKITGQYKMIVVFLVVGEVHAHTVKNTPLRSELTKIRLSKETWQLRGWKPRYFLTIADHTCSANPSLRRTYFISVCTLVVNGRRLPATPWNCVHTLVDPHDCVFVAIDFVPSSWPPVAFYRYHSICWAPLKFTATQGPP